MLKIQTNNSKRHSHVCKKCKLLTANYIKSCNIFLALITLRNDIQFKTKFKLNL